MKEIKEVEKMPLFPMFVDLRDKNCLVFGGGKVALRKIRTLLLFGMNIQVYAFEYEEELRALIRAGQVKAAETALHFNGDVLPDILGADMVICATNNEVFNHRMAKKCAETGIMVNSATSRKDSSFIFPAVTVRGDLVAGVSTSGQVPALTKAVRAQMDAALPQWYEDFLPALLEARRQVISVVGTQKERQKVMDALTAYGLAHEGDLPEQVVRKAIDNSSDLSGLL